jgi:FtsP/CotA-like multicopper oxidase with cupredoxin domain
LIAYQLLTLGSNNLVNGKANYPCANTTLPCTPNAGLSKFAFESGKKYRLRLINPSSDALQKISLDGHNFTVIAYDFTPIQPVTTELITLGIGQRADVIVEAQGTSDGSYWFRSTLGPAGPGGCSLPDGISPNAMAVVYYEDADPDAVPTTTSDITPAQIGTCANDPLSGTVPLFPITSDYTGQLITEELEIEFFVNSTGKFVWAVNNVTALIDYNVAQLAQAAEGTYSPLEQW